MINDAAPTVTPVTSGADGAKSKDPWDSTTYSQKVAPFTWVLTHRVVSLLDLQPTDNILDIGCGDGVLTSQLSRHCSHVTGIDASPNMIASALSQYSTANTTYRIVDCTQLETETSLVAGTFTKLFSNAALHWILRNPLTRSKTLAAAYSALKPGGIFVAEMGGHGNVAEAHAASVSALIHRGVSPERAREASPWFFPSKEELRTLLESVGFVVDLIELEYRPTELTKHEEGGLEGWVRFYGERFWAVLPESERQGAVREACEALEGVTRRTDGVYMLGYVRLRFVARRPE